MFHGREFYCVENFSKNNSKWTKGRYYRLGYEREGLFYLMDDSFFHYVPLTEDELDSNFCDIY